MSLCKALKANWSFTGTQNYPFLITKQPKTVCRIDNNKNTVPKMLYAFLLPM